MPNIKPISDLRNYAAALSGVCEGSPLFLTRNGRGCYAVLDINEEEMLQEKAAQYDRMKAQLELMCDLTAGRRSGETEGWISAAGVRAQFVCINCKNVKCQYINIEKMSMRAMYSSKKC